MADEYRQGSNAALTVQFYEYPSGPASAVTGLTITITPAAGGAAVIGPTSTGVTNPATGLYAYTWAIALAQTPADYIVLWQADGGIQASEVVTVTAAVGTMYGSLAALKRARRIPTDDTTDDADLEDALVRASRAIDRRAGRRFYADDVASARTYATRGRVSRNSDGYLLIVDDISTTTDLVVELGDGTTWTAITDYFVEPDNAITRGWAIESIRRDLGGWTARRARITARWGWPAIPDDVAQASELLANRRFMRRDSPEGVAGWSDQGPIRVSRFDSDVEDLLQPYVLDGLA